MEEKLQKYDGSIASIEQEISKAENKEKEIRSSIDKLQVATEERRKIKPIRKNYKT